MFQMFRLQFANSNNVMSILSKLPQKVQNLKFRKNLNNFDIFKTQNKKYLVNRELYEIEKEIYKILNKFRIENVDHFTQMNFQLLSLELKILEILITKGNLREKISFNQKKSEVLSKIFENLEILQQNQFEIEIHLEQLKILGLIKGQLSNEYIDHLCKIYQNESIQHIIENTIHQMLDQQILNERFNKLIICQFINKPDNQTIDFITEQNLKTNDEEIQKKFLFKAIQYSISEGYKHTEIHFIEQCLNYKWNIDESKWILNQCDQLNSCYKGKNILISKLKIQLQSITQ